MSHRDYERDPAVSRALYSLAVHHPSIVAITRPARGAGGPACGEPLEPAAQPWAARLASLRRSLATLTAPWRRPARER